MQTRRTIAFVLFDRALGLNVTGPAEVFGMADHLLGGGRYDLQVLSEAGGLVRTTSGLAVDTRPLSALDLSRLDTLIVVGGKGAADFPAEAPLIGWIRRAAHVARRVCSVCNGAFLLAAAGLLDGRRAVTHWCEVPALRARYPQVKVELDPIYLRDGPVWTSAGMSAGIDLALALVEDDHGRRVSLAVAKDLVVFLRRSGGQAQFSGALAAQTRLGAAPSKLTELPAWIVDNLAADLSVEALARSVGMAPRSFARAFVRWHGGTPAKLVQELRLEAACRHLEEGAMPVKRIAALCGFGDEERMRRAFLRRLGVPPAAYRERFGGGGRRRWERATEHPHERLVR
ncbi:GlxA family transcriptional regulator [Inquilinus limosus]|uniref:GlxA family transcriptional regulator n=1 Tax=Inquilinus limosus TaxID=171674 RepID=UPI0003F75734|nr:helix-turn-helix domain-containing protein [Inquilinus limosus]